MELLCTETEQDRCGLFTVIFRYAIRKIFNRQILFFHLIFKYHAIVSQANVYPISGKKRFSFRLHFTRCYYRTRWYGWRLRYLQNSARYFGGCLWSDVICSESWLVTPYESPFAPSIYPHSSPTSMAGISLRNCGKINLQPLTPRLHYHPQFTFDFAPFHSRVYKTSSRTSILDNASLARVAIVLKANCIHTRMTHTYSVLARNVRTILPQPNTFAYATTTGYASNRSFLSFVPTIRPPTIIYAL